MPDELTPHLTCRPLAAVGHRLTTRLRIAAAAFAPVAAFDIS